MNRFLNIKRKFVLFCLLLLACGASAQADRYWSGGSSASDNFSEAYNWFYVSSPTNPNSGDNLYFNNTTGVRHFIYSNYGTGSWFNNFITYNGAGGIKLCGDNTYAFKFENNNDVNLLELSPNSAISGSREIGNRIDHDLEINPVGSGGILVSSDKISMDNLNGTRNLKIYGNNTLTINGIIYEKNGTSSTLQILNAATVELKGNSVFTGLTTINGGVLKLNASGGALKSGNAVAINGGTLRIMESQTIGDLNLSSGTLQVDYGKTLTITGSYNATSGTINNLGTIKFAGGSVTFPGSATINNGTANTLTNLEVATSVGVVTLNSIMHATGVIAVSSGTLALTVYNLHLNNGSLNIASGAVFDNGGENQIINESNGSINISGTFITRDAQGFVGGSTSIPSIIPILNTGSTVEYGLSGNQAVQGSTSPTYSNITFSGSGTKTLASTNNPTGIILIKNSAILDVGNHSFGGTGTNLTMSGTSEFKTAGTDVKPDAGGTYSLGSGTKITFTNLAGTLQSIRLSPNYYNIDIVGTSVGTDTKVTGIKFQSGGTLTIKNGATFKLSNTAGFTGVTNTAISNTNSPIVILESGSTVEYAGADQFITNAEYSNLTVSGTGTKTIPTTELVIGNDLKVNATATLKIESGKTITVKNAVAVASTATMTLESNDSSQSASLVQINDTDTNSGNVRYDRTTTPILSTDYTYWSSPVFDQTLLSVSPNTSLNRFFLYDPSIKNWERISSPSKYKMILGKGYIFWGPTTYTSIPAVYKASFIGKPNNGKIEIPIAGTVNVKTYNLIGNPYPSAINADAFLDKNSAVLAGTIYFWTHNTSMQLASAFTDPTKAGSGTFAYTSDDYATYNKTGGTSAAPSGVLTGKNVTIPNGKIAAGQAFFTTSIVNGNAVFKNAMRLKGDVSGENNSQFFRTTYSKKVTENTIEKNRIWLDLTNDKGAFKQTLVGYIEGASNDYESRYDGLSMNGNKYLDFYSINQDKNFVIQGRALPFDENDEVSLGFKTSISGDFTMNIDQADGLLTNQAVFIEDKVTQTIFDLRSGNYTFNTISGVFNDRFVLHYTNKTLGNTNFEKDKNQITVSTKNKQITVNSIGDKIDKVRVYDILGKQIYIKNNINSNVFTIANLVSNKQMLLLKITLQNGKITNKKIVY